MTIASATSRVSYTGNGVTFGFVVPFYFAANVDLVVYLTDTAGNAALQLLGTHYTLAGATLSAGGVCSFITIPPTGYSVSIYRDPAMTQTTSYNNNDPFPAKSHELALDKALTIDQRTRNLVERSLRQADSDPTVNMMLAAPATRANKVLGFDSNGALTYANNLTASTGGGITAAVGLLNVDSRATATVTIVPNTVTTMFTGGYLAPGDGGQAKFYRVAADPGGIAKVRTADRFLPSGTIDAANGGWWSMVLENLNDIRKFGVFSDGTTDSTALFQGAVTACVYGTLVIQAAASFCKLTADITIPSNRRIWNQTGSTIQNTGGRFFAYTPGGGNIHIVNDGTFYFAATATAASMFATAQWGGGGSERGCFDFGGSVAAPAGNFSFTGNGRVYSDYVFTTVAATGIYDLVLQINRKGIAFYNCHDVLVTGQEVDHIYGEVIYHNGASAASSYNVRFMHNHIHHCAFDALNFNTFTATDNMIAAFNYVENCFVGVEMSSGVAYNNHISSCFSGINTGGGGGAYGGRILNNRIFSTISDAINVAFDLGGSAVVGWEISGNRILFAGGFGIFCDKIDSFTCTNNLVNLWAGTSAGRSYSFGSSTSNGFMTGNVSRTAGGFSTGGFTDAGAGNTAPAGTNPVS